MLNLARGESREKVKLSEIIQYFRAEIESGTKIVQEGAF